MSDVHNGVTCIDIKLLKWMAVLLQYNFVQQIWISSLLWHALDINMYITCTAR